MKNNYHKFARLCLSFSKIINKWSWAYYIGGQETTNRLETQRRQLENEERKLRIEKLRRELGITTGTSFSAIEYPEPGNIREEERKRSN